MTKVAEGQHLRLWSLGYLCFNLLGSEPILLSLRTQTYFRLLREVTAGNTLHPVVLHILSRVRTDIGFFRLGEIVAYIIAQVSAYLYRGKRLCSIIAVPIVTPGTPLENPALWPRGGEFIQAEISPGVNRNNSSHKVCQQINRVC